MFLFLFFSPQLALENSFVLKITGIKSLLLHCDYLLMCFTHLFPPRDCEFLRTGLVLFIFVNSVTDFD